jgi:hypothetical protein
MARNVKMRFSSSRRKLVLGVGASLVMIRLSPWLNQAAAQSPAAGTSTPAPPQPAALRARFLALSTFLTGKTQLNPLIAARLLRALSSQSADFEKTMIALADVAQQQRPPDVEALAATVRDDISLTDMLHRIVAAWYLGIVGDAVGGKVVAFDRALMFDPVRDVVVVPSYCRAGPGYWVAQPPRLAM